MSTLRNKVADLFDEWRALNQQDRDEFVKVVEMLGAPSRMYKRALLVSQILRAAAEPEAEAKASFCTECLGKRWNTGPDGNPVSCSKCTAETKAKPVRSGIFESLLGSDAVHLYGKEPVAALGAWRDLSKEQRQRIMDKAHLRTGSDEAGVLHRLLCALESP